MTDNKKYQQLLFLGGVERQRFGGISGLKKQEDWFDYQAMGFTCDDIPFLIELIGKPELNRASETSNEVWIPLHAWRTLGQLKNNQCVEPLLALLDTVLVNDDWALEELPEVFGMIGPSCTESLNRYLNESYHDEFARVIAADGLKCIAQNHPDARETVLTFLTHFLDNTTNEVDSLNSLVVNMLIDLNATETIDTIRNIYQTDKVDITMAGDIEDIEIELGLRTERETPKPFYGAKQNPPPVMPFPADDAGENSIYDAYESINYYLAQYGNEDSISDISELDGFFAAIGCSPEMIMPSQWMPAIWGGEEKAPNWPDKKEAQDFIDLCMAYYNEIMGSLIEYYFEPLFMETIIDNRTITIVNDWCRGFLRGINLWQPLKATDADFLTDALEPVQLFSTEDGLKKVVDMSSDEIENWHLKIQESVINMHRHFVMIPRILNQQPVLANKTGRNEPCPCGSGKKYKKCCLH